MHLKSGQSTSTGIQEGAVMLLLVSRMATFMTRNKYLIIRFPIAYVHSVMDVQTNLHLRTNSRVSRVIFEGTTAVGVAYVHSKNRAHKGELRETIVSDRIGEENYYIDT